MNTNEMQLRAASSSFASIGVHSWTCHHHGFSFIEVMFAVVILGIGFIMLAAVFPVATVQIEANVDASNATIVAQNASAIIPVLTHDSEYTEDGPAAFCESATLWGDVQGSVIYNANPRYAWVPFYQVTHDANGKQVHLTVIVAKAREKSQYSATDLNGDVGALAVHNVKIPAIIPGTDGMPDTVQISKGSKSDYATAAPGAYLLIRQAGSPLQLFRLGELIAESPAVQTWSINPEQGSSTPNACNGVVGSIIGRDITGSTPSSEAQDVAVFRSSFRPQS